MAIVTSEISFRQKITGTVPAATNDGQILLINEGSVDAAFWTAVSNGGGNILAYADVDGGTRLPLQVVKCDTANSTLLLWSRKPSYAISDRDIVIMCSNTVTTQPATNALFGRDAVRVDDSVFLTLGGSVNNTTGGYESSTGNYNATGVSMSLPAVNANFGMAQDFDGTADFIKIPAGALDSAEAANKLFLSCWVNMDSLAVDGTLIGQFTSIGLGGGSSISSLYGCRRCRAKL